MTKRLGGFEKLIRLIFLLFGALLLIVGIVLLFVLGNAGGAGIVLAIGSALFFGGALWWMDRTYLIED